VPHFLGQRPASLLGELLEPRQGFFAHERLRGLAVAVATSRRAAPGLL
jgi:hypothetical protein